MNTEITDINAITGEWLFFDDECRFCVAWAESIRPWLAARRFRLSPLRSAEATRVLGAVDFSEIKLRLTDGTVLGGADALAEIARRIWWTAPLGWLCYLPGVMPLLRRGYRFIAANRHCLNGSCHIRPRHKWSDWLLLVLLPAIALAVRDFLPAWIFMWLLAFALYFGCKWLTFRRSLLNERGLFNPAALGYLLAWPGMDAEAFVKRTDATRPRGGDWAVAAGKTIIGIGLVTLAITLLAEHRLLAGWMGMVGIVLSLHFGTFRLLALFWQATGHPVKPMMRAPLFATSVADFWGNRWNTAFHKLAYDLIFRPLVRRVGVSCASFAVFAVSGLIHDLVISVPARGGYGLPTLYFLLQSAGVWFERSALGHDLGLGKGWRGRVFALSLVALPVLGLFHPPFVHNIILPMLHAIGATLNML